jgi:hypothetical protein
MMGLIARNGDVPACNGNFAEKTRLFDDHWRCVEFGLT